MFCPSCQLFVCDVCWIPSRGSCSSCAFAVGGVTRSSAATRVATADTIGRPPLLGPPRVEVGIQPRPRPRTMLHLPRLGVPRIRAPRLRLPTAPRSVTVVLRAAVTDLPFRIAVATMLAVGLMAAGWAMGMGSHDHGVIVESGQASGSGGRTAAPSASVTPSGHPPSAYVVRRGDTLRAIARRLLGSEGRWTAILDANRDRISDPENLTIGVTLRMPAT